MNFPKLYECDPQKNTECNKRNCGNPCKHTTRKEFAREPSGGELLGKIVVVTQMRKIPAACAACKYYENMGRTPGYGNDGVCTARGELYATQSIKVSKERLNNCPLRVIGGQRMRHKKKSRLAAAELIAVFIVTAVVFIKSRGYALAWRGYEAVGGELMLLLLPIIYYEAKRIILDFVADFIELYRDAPED